MIFPYLLNVAMIIPYTEAAGPGLRTGIWLQGCSLQCTNCQSPEFKDHIPKHLIPPDKLFKLISSFADSSGITISGGEPFQQAAALHDFLKLYNSLNKTTIVFTGYQKKEILETNQLEIIKILELIDAIIPGNFREDLKKNSNQLGSPNQEVVILTQKLKLEDFSPLNWEMSNLKNDYNGKNSVKEFSIRDLEISISGKSSEQDFEVIEKFMQKKNALTER